MFSNSLQVQVAWWNLKWHKSVSSFRQILNLFIATYPLLCSPFWLFIASCRAPLGVTMVLAGSRTRGWGFWCCFHFAAHSCTHMLVACQYKRANSLVCLEHHPFTSARHLASVIYAMLLQASAGELSPADQREKPCMTHSSCRRTEQECIKVCIKLSTASRVLCTCSWAFSCHRKHQKIEWNRALHLCRERQKALKKGKMAGVVCPTTV